FMAEHQQKSARKVVSTRDAETPNTTGACQSRDQLGAAETGGWRPEAGVGVAAVLGSGPGTRGVMRERDAFAWGVCVDVLRDRLSPATHELPSPYSWPGTASCSPWGATRARAKRPSEGAS